MRREEEEEEEEEEVEDVEMGQSPIQLEWHLMALAFSVNHKRTESG